MSFSPDLPWKGARAVLLSERSSWLPPHYRLLLNSIWGFSWNYLWNVATCSSIYSTFDENEHFPRRQKSENIYENPKKLAKLALESSFSWIWAVPQTNSLKRIVKAKQSLRQALPWRASRRCGTDSVFFFKNQWTGTLVQTSTRVVPWFSLIICCESDKGIQLSHLSSE